LAKKIVLDNFQLLLPIMV